MARRYRAELTAADIATGVPRRTKKCPVFIACDRAAGARVQAIRHDGSIVMASWRDRYGLDAVMSDQNRKLVRDAVEAIDMGFPEMVETPMVFFFEEPA